MPERRWIDLGGGSWDLDLGVVRLQMAKEPDGWFIWGVAVDGFSIGKRAPIPSPLGEQYDKEIATASAPDRGRP